MLVRFSRLLAVFSGVAGLFLASTLWAQPVGGGDVCATIGSLSQTGLTTGSTNGIVGATLAQGEIITMSTTLGTATGGTFRIVADSGGVNTLAGPSPIPGTLRFSGVPLPPGSQGIGFFIDSATGGTVNLTASCALQSIPTLSENMLMALGALLLLAGAAVLVRRRGS
jgi:hypothetical protein